MNEKCAVQILFGAQTKEINEEEKNSRGIHRRIKTGQLNPNEESHMNLNLELMRVVCMYGKATANDATHVS